MADKQSRQPPIPRHRRRLDVDRAAEEAEAQLFREEMMRLDAVPDKDRASGLPRGPRPPQRLKIPRSASIRPDDSLDLHGLKIEEARFALDRFAAQARRLGWRVVLVITGKGRRSPGGVAVLKNELERWIMAEGASHVRAFGEAPRAQGGAGAYVLYLR